MEKDDKSRATDDNKRRFNKFNNTAGNLRISTVNILHVSIDFIIIDMQRVKVRCQQCVKAVEGSCSFQTRTANFPVLIIRRYWCRPSVKFLANRVPQ